MLRHVAPPASDDSDDDLLGRRITCKCWGPVHWNVPRSRQPGPESAFESQRDSRVCKEFAKSWQRAALFSSRGGPAGWILSFESTKGSTVLVLIEAHEQREDGAADLAARGRFGLLAGSRFVFFECQARANSLQQEKGLAACQFAFPTTTSCGFLVGAIRTKLKEFQESDRLSNHIGSRYGILSSVEKEEATCKYTGPVNDRKPSKGQRKLSSMHCRDVIDSARHMRASQMLFAETFFYNIIERSDFTRPAWSRRPLSAHKLMQATT